MVLAPVFWISHSTSYQAIFLSGCIFSTCCSQGDMKGVPVEYHTLVQNGSSESSSFLPSEECVSNEKFSFLKTRPWSWLVRLWSNTDSFRVASSACAICAFFVFLLNLSTFAWATIHRGFSVTGRQLLYRGDCKTVARMDSAVHFLINVLSTLLLSSSGYCMQYLSAPTRQEVSHAHSKGRWLDIGVLSMRNLLRIEKKRALLWLVLAVISLPLHLFYNSMIFVTNSTNLYWPLQVSSGFVENPSGTFLYEPHPPDNVTSRAFTDEVQRMKNLLENNTLERLEPIDCINSYNVRYQTTYGSVLLVSDNSTAMVHDTCNFCAASNQTCTSFYDSCQSTSSSGWMCDEGFPYSCLYRDQAQELRNNAGNWKPNGVFLDDMLATAYCLAERKDSFCFLQSNPHVAVIVLALNLAKAIVMLVVSRQTTGRSLVTVGDAICSFLETPDPFTERMCLASQLDFKKMRRAWVRVPKTYTRTRAYCFSAAGKVQWAGCIVMYSLAVGLGYLYLSIFGSVHNIIGYGFGTSSVAIGTPYGVDTAGIFLAQIIVANSFQIWLSILFFVTNRFVTAICAQSEWSSYAKSRKGLRVSSGKRGAQRSTYFLQIPYRYSVPLLGIFGVLHWLISQSFFVLDEFRNNTAGYDIGNRDLDSSSSVGSSPLASMISLVLLTALLLLILVQGLWTTQIDMPMLRSCSAVIAAACQPKENEIVSGAHLEGVQWGVICEPMGSDVDAIGHCGISAGYVNLPVEGRSYAG